MNQIPGTKSGRYVLQPGGYRAFIPAPLLPAPPLIVDAEMQVLLSAADRAVGRLDAATEPLPLTCLWQCTSGEKRSFPLKLKGLKPHWSICSNLKLRRPVEFSPSEICSDSFRLCLAAPCRFAKSTHRSRAVPESPYTEERSHLQFLAYAALS
jgi:hypothetical protein